MKVTCREGAGRVMAMGLFPDAEVVRGHDWIWGDQDGNVGFCFSKISHCSEQ